MNVQEITRAISDGIGPVLGGRNAFLVDLRVRPERRSAFIQVFVDTDDGITIQQCAELSRDIAAWLDASDILGGATYRLEVSSPGLDRPLKLLRQYRKNIGRTLRVRFSQDAEERSVTGTLLSVEGDLVTIEPPHGEPISVPFDRIVESREELPW